MLGVGPPTWSDTGPSWRLVSDQAPTWPRRRRRRLDGARWGGASDTASPREGMSSSTRCRTGTRCKMGFWTRHRHRRQLPRVSSPSRRCWIKPSGPGTDTEDSDERVSSPSPSTTAPGALVMPFKMIWRFGPLLFWFGGALCAAAEAMSASRCAPASNATWTVMKLVW